MREKGKPGYERDFKVGAVKLVLDEKKTVAQVSKDLGVSDKSLYKWIREFNADSTNAFPGSGKTQKGPEDELKRLREENRILRMERDLLKKTLPIFMQSQK